MSTFSLNLNRNPVSGNLESSYVGANTLTVTGTGFGSAPTVAVFQDWSAKTPGARAAKGVWDSAIYGSQTSTDFPQYYTLDGVTGIGNRNLNTNITYTITATPLANYQITIDGVPFTYTALASTSQAAIVSALSSSINANSSIGATASGTTSLILSRKNASIPFSVYSAGGTDTAANGSGAGINMISDINLTGFVKLFGQNVTEYLVMYDIGVPDGYYFSGETNTHTIATGSNAKIAWLSDQAIDDEALADICCPSSVSGAWSVVGNQSPNPIAIGSGFDFNKRNGMLIWQKAGANPFANNGTTKALRIGSWGVAETTKTDKPIFVKRATIYPTVQNLATYTVTINGVPLTSYVSGASATRAQIIAGIKAAVNGSTTDVTAIDIPTGTGVAIVSNTSLDFTISTTANAPYTMLAAQYDRISIPAWAGNGNQVNTLFVLPYVIVQVGANAGKLFILGNDPTFINCTATNALNFSSWSDTVCQPIATAAQRARLPYLFFWNQGTVTSLGMASQWL